MNLRLFRYAFFIGMAVAAPSEGGAQTTETEPTPEATSPAGGTDSGAHGTSSPPDGEAASPDQEVPPVEVVQPKPEPQARVKPRPRRKQARRPAPPPQPRPVQAEPALPSEITEPIPGYYGPPGGQGAFERAMDSAQSPINPVTGIVPGDLQDFSSAASRITTQQLDEQQPLSANDALQRVPGISIVGDDGFGRHGGIGMRGSPARRSRKVLVLEDGRSINMSLWLDPSTHYVPPLERLESIEVLRGTVIVHGPNNNHGVVNFKNLSPFGPKETVISGEGGTVNLTGPGQEAESAAKWHAHTRQTAGNWGTVLAYTGANVQGAWDTERLRYNDFYAALGWKGYKQDFTFSAVYDRQRDDYDEANFEGEEDDEPGEVEREFFQNIKHCKTCYNIGSVFNTYNADIVLLQGVHNFYFDADTTLTTRVYGQHHRRDRYQNFEGENPAAAEDDFSPIIVGDDALIPEGVMLGRLRTYDHVGVESRAELANRAFLFGLKQDIQVGARFEHHTFSNRNFFGSQGEILRDGDSRGLTVFNRDTEADAFSTFLQSDIHVTRRLDIVPGVRLDHYDVSRRTTVLSEEEGEGEETDCPEFDNEECVIIEVDTNPFNDGFDKTKVLPGVAFAYGLGQKEAPLYDAHGNLPAGKPQYHTTIYGGYHRGLTMGVLREATFPPDDEIGNNFQIGVRSTALKGLTFDVAGFHQRIENYQVKGASTDAVGNNVYTNLDEVEINGFEAYGRLDTRPYTGWRINPYAEATYTLADSVIEKGIDEEGVSLVGNLVPEVPDEVAYLTLGVEGQAGWNASVSWIYRGGFFTDEQNTPFGGDPEGEDGFVPSVWLLNARVNYTIPGTNTLLFVSGENLADKLYIVDREDGIKPGLGRSIMGGAKMKW